MVSTALEYNCEISIGSIPLHRLKLIHHSIRIPDRHKVHARRPMRHMKNDGHWCVWCKQHFLSMHVMDGHGDGADVSSFGSDLKLVAERIWRYRQVIRDLWCEITY